MAFSTRLVELPSLRSDQFAKEDCKPSPSVEQGKINHLRGFEFKTQVRNSLADGDAVRLWAKGNPLAAVRTQLEPGFTVHSVHRVSLELEQTRGCFWEILKKGEDVVSLRSPHAGGRFLTSRWTTCDKSGAKNFYLAAVDNTETNKELWRIKNTSVSSNRMHCVLQNTRWKQHKIRVEMEVCGSFGLDESHDSKPDSGSTSPISTKEVELMSAAEKLLGPQSEQGGSSNARENLYTILRAHHEQELLDAESKISSGLVGRALMAWFGVSKCKAPDFLKYEEFLGGR